MDGTEYKKVIGYKSVYWSEGDESIIEAQRGRDRGQEKDQVNIKPTLCLYFLHGFNKGDKFLTFDK